MKLTYLDKCPLNSIQVKPNLGHSEGAAALTSIMKAVLSLEHRTIIPNIKFKNPNQKSECNHDVHTLAHSCSSLEEE